MFEKVKRRLDKLGSRSGYIDSRLRDRLNAGAYYDELTDLEKELYAQYRGTNREALEQVEKLFDEALHFRIERRTTPDNEAPFKWLDEAFEEYNKPEREEQRRKEYEELQRLGELRREDFYHGRDMDKEHPLPWAKGVI